MKNTFSLRVREMFGLDIRSLAFYRRAIALFALGDLLIRVQDLRAHYTDFGLLPRFVLMSEPLGNPWRISIHFMSGELWVQALLFLFAAAFSLMLFLGFRTRLASFGLWFLTLSLQARNPMILQGGDVVFRMALFFNLFLPLDGKTSEKSPRIFSAATFAFILQVAFIYWFTLAVKTTKPESWDIWWRQGMAVYNVLNIDQFARPLGQFLLTLPLWVLKGLNYFTLGVEILGPLFLIFPFNNSKVRMFGIFLLVFLHLGFGSCLALGPFPFIGMVTLIPLIPGTVWDRLKIKPHILMSGASSRLEIAGQILALLSILYVFFWNLGTVGFRHFPQNLRGIGYTLEFDQYWDMFSPPLTDDGWYVIPGYLRNGKQVDIYRSGAALNWNKPKKVSDFYKNERWRKYMMNYWLGDNAGYRLYFGQYLCREWNRTHASDEALENFEVFFMREDTSFYRSALPKKVSIWQHYCFNAPPPSA